MVASDRMKLTSLELCAGAGGQALGLEQADFSHLALVELDPHACDTLRLNRPAWDVIRGDLKHFDAKPYRGVDLLAAGVPCPPFSVAGKQLGHRDERDLFPRVVEIARACEPKAIMVENVRGLLDPSFESYRDQLAEDFEKEGYDVYGWRLLHASDFGVPQLRPRAVFVALRSGLGLSFEWPRAHQTPPPSVGEVLFPLMASRGWRGAQQWARHADKIAPTLVGGSKKHGGPDLGPTRARRAWAALGVDALALADEPPGRDHRGMPRLTVAMAALIQGFPSEWRFAGKKTPAYRQVGNAFPPPVAHAVGAAIREALLCERKRTAGAPRRVRKPKQLPLEVA